LSDSPVSGRLLVMASGSGTNFQAILDACLAGRLEAEVVALATDKDCTAIRRAESAGIPVIYQPWSLYRDAGSSREQYDRDLAEKVQAYKPDFVILAGWMRLLSMAFLKQFPMRVINLHPALPGSFPGTHAIDRAFESFRRGEITRTGVMVHFVPDEGVDDGPVICKEEVPIFDSGTLETLEARIHEVEHRIFVQAIGTALENVNRSLNANCTIFPF